MGRLQLLALLLAACGGSPTPAGDDVDPPTDGPPPPPCGLRGGQRGLTPRTATIDGKQRTYLAYLPDAGDPTTPIPLVMVFHGFTMSGQLMFDITEYKQLADTEHVVLVFPDGQGGPNTQAAPWNVGTNLCPSFFGPPPVAPGDDFALIDAMKADVALDQCIDRDHIYATGFSMGGYFSHHIGCMRDDVRAVAPHSGGTHDLAGCANDRMPIIIFHGSSDPVIPAGCDDPKATAVQNIEPSADAWAAHNGCATTTTSRAVTNGTCVRYDGCPAGGQVELCTFPGMGHCWAGGAASTGVYACPTYAQATQLEWEFFKQFAF
jgi:polyhydroxybutyrate depolymerase